MAQARDLLAAGCPVQLLLSNLHLPDGSGLALCQELQATASRPVPLIVVFSGGIDTLLEQQLRRSGVWQVLHKPVPLGQLVQCVEHALSGPLPSRPTRTATSSGTHRPGSRFFNGNQALFLPTARHACSNSHAIYWPATKRPTKVILRRTAPSGAQPEIGAIHTGPSPARAAGPYFGGAGRYRAHREGAASRRIWQCLRGHLEALQTSGNA